MPAVDSRIITVLDRRTGQTRQISRDALVRAAMSIKIANHVRWLIQNVHRTDKGRPVDMSRNPQWEQIAFDSSPDLVVASAAQTGKSLIKLIRIIAAADLGLECLIILPKDDKRSEFVHTRWEDTVKNTPYYRERLRYARGSDSTTLKHFGNGKLHIKTAAADDDLIAFSCDYAAVDEYDFCNKINLSKYPKRMNASDFMLTHESSTPTLPGAEDLPQLPAPDNIMTRFMRGDRHQYHSTCESCGERQVLGWFSHVVLCERDDQGRIFKFNVRDQDWSLGATRDLRPCCQKCDRPMDRSRPGLWIPDRPGARIRSYHVNRLNSMMGEALGAFIPKFAEAINNPSKMMEFCNMDLGIEFAGGIAGFTRELLVKAASAGDYSMRPSSPGPCSAGIDCNVPFYDVQISKWGLRSDGKPLQVKLHAAKVQGKDALYALMRRFNVRIAVMDQQPEVNHSQKIQAEFPENCNGATLIRARYSPHPLKNHLIVSEKGELPIDPPKLITLDRTNCIDGLLSSFLSGEVHWFRNFDEVLEGRHVYEMTKLIRKTVTTEAGSRFAWEGEPAHQSHAAALDRMCNDPLCNANLVNVDSNIVLTEVDSRTRKYEPEPSTEAPAWLTAMRG